MTATTTSLKSKTSVITSKEVWIGWISSLVEAYNMAIYLFIAPLLAKFLFQHTTEGAAVFFSYCLILVGCCFLYPAGAIYYGFIGDKQGRQKTCVYSTLGLGIATGLMAFVPLHLLPSSAWILFLVLVCAQHFFSGGEYHGSIVFSLEHGEQQKNGLMSGLCCLFAVFGLVAANGLATLAFVMEDDIWIRICFLTGGLGGMISYILKNYCRETPAFTALSKETLEKVDWSTFFKSEWKTIGTAVAVLAFFFVSYTFIFIFLPLMPFEQGASENFDTFKSLIAYGVLLVATGLMADRWGIEKVMLAGMSLFAIVVVPLCYLCNNLLILQMVLTPCACLVIGPIHGWMLSQFEAKNRCRGIFVSSAIATSIFAGSTVPLCLMIFDLTNSLVICSLYPMAIGLGSLVCFLPLALKHQPQKLKVT